LKTEHRVHAVDGVTVPEPGGLLRVDMSVPGHGLTFKTADAEKYGSPGDRTRPALQRHR
jgi:hypothetical protein